MNLQEELVTCRVLLLKIIILWFKKLAINLFFFQYLAKISRIQTNKKIPKSFEKSPWKKDPMVRG